MSLKLLFGLAVVNVMLTVGLVTGPSEGPILPLGWFDCCQGTVCCRDCCWFTANCDDDADCVEI